jgi:DNA-binding NarL/FixJ family response regulator
VNRQHVLVVEDELFSELVRSLLDQVKDLNVAGFAPRDEAELIGEIERTQSAVVVLDAATRLTDPQSLWCHLNGDQDLRVVAVSTEDNTVQVYDKQQVLITRGEDLVAIIRSWVQM